MTQVLQVILDLFAQGYFFRQVQQSVLDVL